VFDTYADIFEQRADAYHSAMRKWARARDAEFRSVLEPLRDAPDGLVCDMPSGGGYLADYLRPGLRYLGVDPAEGFIDACSEEAPLNTLKSPITAVPLPDDSVDYIVSLAGLHHEPSLASVFAEMHRLARPGGRVVIADAAVDTAPARFLNGFVARNNPRGHDGRFLDVSTRALLEAAGLAVADDELIEVPWVFASMQEAGAFCGELFGVSGASPEAVSDALAEEIGFDEKSGRLYLRWTLRRIVCDVA
jgi:SAM-dependent methyltransferase